ncbi:MAG: PLP-dependent aminotransferase family protein [Clostridia bacterium]|nr:PLP-dependent aminotransferase family protein [Clostridia bacterium]
MKKLFSSYSDEPLYIQLYMYYRDMIINGEIKSGDKLPSVRKCALEYGISKMTVENAYMQLVSEGYIYAKSQSGYYVSKISDLADNGEYDRLRTENINSNNAVNEPTVSAAENECFNFKLWQKYVKNALRCEDRLLTYGEYQGERDLREALSEYASKQRGVVCSADDIVVGAGVQNLLQLLCNLDADKGTVLFTGTPFIQGRTVFEDYGYEVTDSKARAREGKLNFIYTSPSRSNKFNSVMNISDRIDMLNFAVERGSIVIEDDYDSEFCYFARPVPSLQGLDRGENVAYIGTFSKLLLPSIRISFMVLPQKLREKYSERGRFYNQTASKTEQIALARYITDGKLVTQIRKARKHYESKAEQIIDEIEKQTNPLKVGISDSGFMLWFEYETVNTAAEIERNLCEKNIKIKQIEQIDQNRVRLFVNSTTINIDEIGNFVNFIKNTLT